MRSICKSSQQLFGLIPTLRKAERGAAAGNAESAGVHTNPRRLETKPLHFFLFLFCFPFYLPRSASGGGTREPPHRLLRLSQPHAKKLRKHTRTEGGGGGGKGGLCGALQSAELGFFGAGSSAVVLVLASGCKPFCRITCPGSSVLRTAQCRDSHVAVPNGHSCIPARVCLNTSRSTEC